MRRVAISGLMKIEFPIGDVLLSEGGVIRWGAETYKGKDATFGAIGSVESLSEGLGEEVPALIVTLLPPASADISDLSAPGYQTSPVRFWWAYFDIDTGEVIGDPDLQFVGQVDQTELSLRRELKITVVSETEKLFELNAGSPLSPTFHKDLFAGETGHDNATGLSRPVAWGIEAPAGTAGAGSGSGRTSWLGGQAA